MSDIDLETSSFIISKLKNEKFIENPSIEKIQSSLEEIIYPSSGSRVSYPSVRQIISESNLSIKN